MAHFSGWDVLSPFNIDALPPSLRQKFYTQTQVEARLRSEIADLMAIVRQQQLLPGLEATYNVVDIARMALQRQFLGVADDPEFDLVGAGLFVPAALVDLTVRVCFKEGYEWCKRTGEFPSLAVYYLSFFRQIGIIGVEPEPDHITLAHDYLKGCGRWRVKVATSYLEDDPRVHSHNDHEVTREFYAQWKAGDGALGIIGSTVEGFGDVETTKLDRSSSCTSTVSNLTQTKAATARFNKLEFDPFRRPIGPGSEGSASPKKLTISVGLGELTYNHQCLPSGALFDVTENFQPHYFLSVSSQGFAPSGNYALQVLEGTATATFEKGWRFSQGPFKATLVQEDNVHPYPQVPDYSFYVRTEVIVEHSPL